MASPSVTTVTPRIASTAPTAIQQQVASGKVFTGALPQLSGVRADSPIAVGNSLYKYASLAGDGGGLFFWNNNEPLVCTQINIDLGGNGNITISVVNLDPTKVNDDLPGILAGEEMIIESVAGARIIALNEAVFRSVLLPYQAIKIVTTASGAAQIAQVHASLERTRTR